MKVGTDGDRTGGWGPPLQRVTITERGAEKHRGVRGRDKNGEEINLLIFHGQPAIITVFNALRAFKVVQLRCVGFHVSVCVCVNRRQTELHYKDSHNTPTSTADTPDA